MDGMDKKISKKVLMMGVYIGKNAPGGMASVVQAYKPYIKDLKYITSWKDTNFIFKLLIAIKAYIQLYFSLVFDRNLEIIHLHTAEQNSFWRKAKFVRLAKFFNKKCIMHIHAATFKEFFNDSSDKVKQKILNVLNKNDAIIVLSESWKEWFIGIGIKDEKLIVINNIIDFPRIEDSNDNNSENKLKILFLGEIGERKGIFDILRAIKEHKDVLQNRIILKIGGNKNEALLRSTIKDFGLSEFVFFEGWVAGEKKVNLENWADVYILPSFNEGLPIGILEAFSYGNAVISSPVGGIPDIIKDKENGLLVTPGNSEEIFDAINLLINDSVLLENLKFANSGLIKKYYPEYVIKQLEELYFNLL